VYVVCECVVGVCCAHNLAVRASLDATRDCHVYRNTRIKGRFYGRQR